MSEDFNYDSEEFVYDSPQPKAKRITLGNKKYVLLEASAEAGAKYKSAAAASARMEDGKVVGVQKIGDIEPMLVADCLAEVDSEGKVKMQKIPGTEEYKPVTVTLTRVKRMPSNHISDWFTWIKKVSKLGDEDTEDSLRKRIKEDTEKLNKLLAARGESPDGEDSEEGNPTEPSPSSPQ